jgi:hypothetical protein
VRSGDCGRRRGTDEDEVRAPLGVREQLVERGAVGDVGGQPETAGLLRHRLGPLGVVVDDDDTRAELRQRAGSLPADAGAAAQRDDRPAVETGQRGVVGRLVGFCRVGECLIFGSGSDEVVGPACPVRVTGSGL